MMEAVREVTAWTGVDYRAPNHDYLLDGDKIVAYRPWGTAEIRTLKTGIKIDRRGRKFEKLDPNPFEITAAVTADPTVVEVQGSKGQIYRVDTAAGTCTCQGFTFRGQCKHVAEIG